jgi:hypothetical protein
MLLTKQQVADFNRDGCVFALRVLSAEQAKHYRRCLESHEAVEGKPRAPAYETFGREP